MGKRNKIRYQSTPKEKILIRLTGRVFLQYRDDDQIAQAAKGDLALYPQNDALHTTRQGDYESTGFSGYFRVDVHDGKDWCPIILTSLFADREHYFSKSECPIDTYRLCEGLLRDRQGSHVRRTYREHYEVDDGV